MDAIRRFEQVKAFLYSDYSDEIHKMQTVVENVRAKTKYVST